MTDTPAVIGEAVLRDYPLRLWALQQEHTQELIREFTFVLASAEDADDGSAPRQLLRHAEAFNARFGPLVAQVDKARQAAYEAGQDRMDLRVPLVEGTPEVLGEVQRVMATVDEYCRGGHLLTLARPPELVALMDWAVGELNAQFEGAEPTPWTGPF